MVNIYKILRILENTSFFLVLGLELCTKPLSRATLPALFVIGIFEIGLLKLFALSGFKLQSSRSLPPE
jgi:hypothetical protein